MPGREPLLSVCAKVSVLACFVRFAEFCLQSLVCLYFDLLRCWLSHFLLCKAVLPTGVEHVNIDLASQKVLVRGNVTPEAVVQQVSKTGKTTQL